MNNKMITIPYADAIEYGENTSALFKALWELTDLIGKNGAVTLRLRQQDHKIRVVQNVLDLPAGQQVVG